MDMMIQLNRKQYKFLDWVYEYITDTSYDTLFIKDVVAFLTPILDNNEFKESDRNDLNDIREEYIVKYYRYINGL